MQGNKQNTFKSVVFGFAVLLAGQALTATVLISRNVPNVDAEIRVKAVVLVSAIALVGAFLPGTSHPAQKSQPRVNRVHVFPEH